MKKFLFCLAASLTLIASCKKQDIANPVTSISEESVCSLTISLPDNGTKATLSEADAEGYRKVSWDAGDQICVNGSVSTSITIDSENPSKATFTFDSPGVSAPFKVCYPASVWIDETHVNLPSYQGDAAGSDNAVAFPMAGYGSSLEDIVLKHLCSYARLQMKGTQTLKYIEFHGNNGEQVSGEFGFDYTSGTPTLTAKETASLSDKRVRVSSSAVLGTGNAKYCILAVPSGTYANAFNIRVVTDEGKYKDLKLSQSTTMERAAVSTFKEFTLTTTGEYFEIADASQWNAFADAVAEKDETATKTYLIELTGDIDFSTVSEFKPLKMYFGGEFCGNGYKIMNATIPGGLMREVRGGNVHDIVIDSSSKMEYDINKDGDDYDFCGLICRTMTTGTITNCINNAPIEVKFGTDPAADRYAGAFVGKLTGSGTISYCTNNGDITTSGTSTLTASVQIGGIAGFIGSPSKMDSCVNNGSITLVAGATSSKEFCAGGIIGYAKGKVTNCVNTGAIASETASAVLKIGGVCGQLGGSDATIFADSPINRMQNSITISGTPTEINCGGLYGKVNSSGTIPVAKTPFSESGSKILFTATAGAGYTNIYIGGLFGLLNAATTLNVKEALNMNKAITADFTAGEVTVKKLCVGGIIGGATNTLKIDGQTVTSGGNVSVIISAPSKDNTKFTCDSTGVGGIVGGADAGATINNAFNTSKQTGTGYSNEKTNGKPFSVGGIAGYIKRGESSLNNCNNSSAIYNHHYNNSSWTTYNSSYAGGIIGSFGAVSDNTYAITIDNCSNSGAVYTLRGAGGGIAGFISNATCKTLSNSGSVSRAQPAGGIAGAAENSSFTNCTNTADMVRIYDVAETSSGGIIGSANGVTLDNCKSSSSITTAKTAAGQSFGSLIGKAAGTNHIGETAICYVKGSVNGTEISSSNLLTTALSGTTLTGGVALWSSENPIKISLIGDSISTFEEYTSGYRTYYSSTTGDVNDWTKTYWGKLISVYLPNAQLEKNISCSGSCVSLGLDAYKDDGSAISQTESGYRPSFITRYDATGIGNPDVVIVYGGTNDKRHSKGNLSGHDNLYSPEEGEVATLCSTATSSLDNNYYAPAYVKLLKKIYADHSGIKVICILGDGMTKGQCDWVSGIVDWFSSSSYAIKCVNFHNDGNDDGTKYDNVNLPKYSGVHPTAIGMNYMANKIYTECGSWIND